MAKKAKSVATADILAGESSYETFFDEVTDAAKKEFPGRVYTGTEADQLLVALPVPSLAIRYLFQQEGFPLGRFLMIVGQQESCKSALAYEICRWHRLANGGATFFDTEGKPSPELMWSILNYDQKAIKYHKCRTLDEWNGALLNWLKLYRDKMDGTAKEPGLGRIVPICFAVDSLTAVMAEKSRDDLLAAGHALQRFALEAKSITDFLKVLSHEIDGYPFSIVGINHLKAGTTPTGVPTRNIGGGAGLRFHQATEIEMRRKSPINPQSKTSTVRRYLGKIPLDGIELTVSVMKNSNAPHQFIDVEMLWYTDYETKIPRYAVDTKTGTVAVSGYEHPQRTFFDWHSATIDILLSVQREKSQQSKMLTDILEVESGDDRRRCSCKELGVTDKDKVTWAELGAILEQRLVDDPSFADALYPVLGIRRRTLFRSGTDFRDIITEGQKAAARTDLPNPFALPTEAE